MKHLVHFFLLAIMAFSVHAVPASAQENETTEAPKQVTVGIYINDIQAIDMASYSYAVDFYLWFRWSDPETDPVSGFEFMNLFDPEGHVEDRLYDEPLAQPDGSLYEIIRHQGLFTAKFPLRTYPFDSQELRISIEDAIEGADALQYVADVEAIAINPEIRLPGFRIGKPRLVIRDKAYPTTFGDLNETEAAAYSRADFIVPISRPVMSGVFKALVPVLLIILSATFALLLDPTHVEARIGLAITALLTLVAMQFTMLSGLPEVAYLTLLDQVYLASYLYILSVIAIVVRGTRVDEQGDIQGSTGAASKLARAGPVIASIVTGAYLALIAVIIIVNLMIG